ncbi:MAG TPA: hypothetical protein IAB62_09920 [Candidatus Coprocola pullicola]|nr:hypothetical protein [Candidatus Coprocola pullicola]
MTKKELEQLQKYVEKLEKQAVFQNIGEHIFSEGAPSTTLLNLYCKP